MRLRQRDLKPYVIKRRIIIKEPDGTTYEEWEPSLIPNPTWESTSSVEEGKSQMESKDYDGQLQGVYFWEDWLDPSFSWITNHHLYDFVILGNVQPAGGKLIVEMYGERANYMMTMFVELGTKIEESNGICINVRPDKDPDYKVVSVKRWNTHYVVDLEKVRE